VSVAQAAEDRTAATVLEAAAAVLADKGGSASMADFAARSGLSRATLYNHFENREALLSALAKATIDAAQERMVEADLDAVPFPEALARMTRALVSSGTKFSLLANGRYVDRDEVRKRLSEPMRKVFQRGIDDGTLRPEFSPEVLQALYRGLLLGALQLVAETQAGVEQATSIVVGVFLNGTGAPTPRP
jgi:TetR/AcrR family transcriptional regulator, mexCD-oprJ operon repressor